MSVNKIWTVHMGINVYVCVCMCDLLSSNVDIPVLHVCGLWLSLSPCINQYLLAYSIARKLNDLLLVSIPHSVT